MADYSNIEISKKLLDSFAKAMVPEIRDFYNSDKGKAYYDKWLLSHPEYDKSNNDYEK